MSIHIVFSKITALKRICFYRLSALGTFLLFWISIIVGRNFFNKLSERLLESIGDLAWKRGDLKTAEKFWYALKVKEVLRLKDKCAYLMSPIGLYAFGEFLLRIDLLLRAFNAGIYKKTPLYVIADSRNVPNKYFLNLLEEKPGVTVIGRDSEFPGKPEESLIRPSVWLHNGVAYHNALYHGHLIEHTNHNKSHTWEIPDRDNLIFEKYLEKFIPKDNLQDRNYVVIHIAEKSGIHSYRDVIDESNYLKAIEELTDRGISVVRIGRMRESNSFNAIEGFFDISSVQKKFVGIDVFLLAKAQFNLLTASGPNSVGYLFGVPAIHTNTFPASFMGLLEADIFIPKDIWFNNVRLNLAEIYTLGLLTPHPPKVIRKCRVEENSSEDIHAAVLEMLESRNRMLEPGRSQTLYRERAIALGSLSQGGRVAANFINCRPWYLGGTRKEILDGLIRS